MIPHGLYESFRLRLFFFNTGPIFCLPNAVSSEVTVAACDARALSVVDETILVVDDDQPVRRVVVHFFLELAGFRVLEACSGAEALELFHANAAQVRLLLTDLNISGISGIELANQIRRQRPSLPIVFLSGAIPPFSATTPRGCLSIDKPFRVRELVRCVQQALA